MIIDFTDSHCSCPDNWLFNYFAYIASIRGNWIERQLEEKAHMDLYWVVLSLDGAPERVKAGKDIFNITSAEHNFRKIVELQVAALSVKPEFRVRSNMRDGMLYAYKAEQAVVSLAKNVARHFAEDNRHFPGHWEWHYHVRAGMGKSLRRMFDALLEAKRGELWSMPEDLFSYGIVTPLL